MSSIKSFITLTKVVNVITDFYGAREYLNFLVNGNTKNWTFQSNSSSNSLLIQKLHSCDICVQVNRTEQTVLTILIWGNLELKQLK